MNGEKVDREAMLGDLFVTPLSAGLSCLAALPSQVDYLVPHPFRDLSEDGTIEDINGRCIDSMHNIFDMKLFLRICA
jgi:hypothetical protein